MKTRQASPSGLNKIKEAINTLQQERGWPLDDDRWLLEASKFLPQQNINGRLVPRSVSLGPWKNFRTGKKAIKAIYFNAFCQMLNLNPLEIIPLEKSLCSFYHQDWGDAPDVFSFFGREEELATLQHWILEDKYRFVGILGIGGVGKTTLSLQLTKDNAEIQQRFNYIIWRSLFNAPPLTDILNDLITFLSGQQKSNLPASYEQQILLLLEYLKTERCLLILDNFDTLLESNNSSLIYKSEYENYNYFLQKIATVSHQSCLLVTSREKLPNLEIFSEAFLQLDGLQYREAKKILEKFGNFSATEVDWQNLIKLYNGHPLALQLASRYILDIFEGNIQQFLQEGKTNFSSINSLLNQHYNRLSNEEKEILYWLAINREPISYLDLKSQIVFSQNKQNLSDNIYLLQHKILVKITNNQIFIEPVLIEFLTEKLINIIVKEIIDNQLEILNNHALIIVQSKEYLVKSQIIMILEPIKQRLIDHFGSRKLLNHLKKILVNQQENYPLKPGYLGGNIFNLLRQLNVDWKGYDFSYLTIRQAYLADQNLAEVNFAHSDLSNSLLKQTFGGVHALAFSPDSNILAVGDSGGIIRLCRIRDGQQISVFPKKHQWWVVSLSFSSDGQKLVSSSLDGTIRLWDVPKHKCIYQLNDHNEWIWTVSFSPDGQTIASGSNDETIRVWDADGECKQILRGHQGWVLGVAFSPDGQTLASGSYDKTIKIWDLQTGKCIKTLSGHKNAIWSVVWTPDGQTIASSGFETAIRLWSVETGKCYRILKGHNCEIKVIGITPDGKTLVSGCFEPTIKFWDLATGECRATQKGHMTGIRTLAISPDGKIAATGDNDQIVKLWDIQTGKSLKTLQGYTAWIWSMAISPDGKTIATSHLDHNIRLWNNPTGEYITSLRGHTAWIWSVAFSGDGNIMASCGDDQTIRLWDTQTNKLLKCFQCSTENDQGGIWAIAFSPDNLYLASGGRDTIVRVWEVVTEEVRVFPGHQSWIFTIAFSPKQNIIASGGDDNTIKIWDFVTEECLMTLEGHTDKLRCLCFSSDGNSLLSSGEDNTIKIWDLKQGICVQTLIGHQGWICSVRFSPDDKMILSGSHDGTIKLWDINTQECVKTLAEDYTPVSTALFAPESETIISSDYDGTIKFWNVSTGKCIQTISVPRPYEGMNITGVKGLTDSQKESLKALGAVELGGG